MQSTINRYTIHALSEGKPHSASIDHYSRGQALYLFYSSSLFSDTVVQSVDELGPIDNF